MEKIKQVAKKAKDAMVKAQRVVKKAVKNSARKDRLATGKPLTKKENDKLKLTVKAEKAQEAERKAKEAKKKSVEAGEKATKKAYDAKKLSGKQAVKVVSTKPTRL